ncbi:MAG: hypothetical protein N2Z22_02855 [Turneriella sp.]|nr:hypothetical protein [Turneriella sp.]
MVSSPRKPQKLWEQALTYTLYTILLLAANAILAATPDVEDSYREALALFERRDLVSTQKAITLLENILKIRPDHTATQALTSFAYAHEAHLLQQLQLPASDYLNSAAAFARVAQSKEPGNPFALKAEIVLHLIAGRKQEAQTLLAQRPLKKEQDADFCYFHAATSDGQMAQRALAKALALKPNHVWIYSDMAMRALRQKNTALAEKWIQALEKNAPATADADLLRAMLATEQKKRSEAKKYWSAFLQKLSDPATQHLMEAFQKKQHSP